MGKKKAERATSNVFALFEQQQIQEFKEAFGLIDQDKDGIIGKGDLQETCGSVGWAVKPDDLDAMLKESPGPLNFTAFLTLFADRVSGTDPEDTIMKGFKLFDVDGKGSIDADYLKDLLVNAGEKLTQTEADQAFKAAPVKAGQLDYEGFVKLITRGSEDQ